ncbi:MAG: saccharopine dehydrogenase, partial [Caldithrix sp. RBG_13_44_9]
MKVVILGGGRVGNAMALDLAQDPQFKVTVADNDSGRLSLFPKDSQISLISQDLVDNQKLQKLVKNYDMVINALPGFMGFAAFQNVITAGVDIVDIAFFPEDPFVLQELAVRNNVSALMDCGVAPGMSNLLLGYAASRLEEISDVKIYVGGLPRVREWPYEYKAVFSPIDVIEEYTRPARYLRFGQVVTEPALSGREFLDFKEVGTLEAFNTDGLRTLLKTISCPNMIEKTMRYPGHVEKIMLLRETGFFEQTPLEINGIKIRPLDLTARLLFPMWEMKPGDEDVTVMRIIIEGRKAEKNIRYEYDLVDRFDPIKRTTSMARTTGYTATMVIRLLAAGLWKEKGVFSPEFLGRKKEC